MASMSGAAAAADRLAQPACPSFYHFNALPSELQCYTLSFLPARVLVRDVARVSRQMKCTIDAYVHRRITAALRPSSDSASQRRKNGGGGGGRDKFQDEPCTLMFEAQRPIDTLTSRHRLYYSHMEYADEDAGDQVSTLQAHFTFVRLDNDMNASMTSNATDSPLNAVALDAYDGPSTYVQGRRGRRRTNTRTGGARSWATWSEPVTSSLAALERGRRATAALAHDRDVRSASRETTTSSRDASLARPPDLHQYGRTAAAAAGAAASHARRPPTYRFQLDALDSFETWILSLTVQRLWWQDVASTTASSSPTTFPLTVQTRPMRWEKRVVEGLDRIFRDWFKATATADNTNTTTNQRDGQADAVAIPDERELELDGQGCIVRIQPHLNEHAETHPALISMSSHYYLSNAAAAAAGAHFTSTAGTANAGAQLPSYVDFTFHCTALRLNAGRLLSVIEDIDLHVDRTRKQISSVTAAAAAVETITVEASTARRTTSDLDGLSSAGFIVMSGRTANGVSWSQAR